jgi:anaerobic dimethyl sulfoxide reductase subunit C (anchor subunit)
MGIEWALVLFTLLTGVSGWTFFFTGLNDLLKKNDTSGFVPALTAIILLALGGVASVFHLSHPERIVGVFSNPGTGIFNEFVIVLLFGLALLAYLICAKRKVVVGTKVMAVIGMILAVVIALTPGFSYIFESRLAWNTYLLPFGFAGTTLPIGAALYWLFAVKDQAASRFMAVCILVSGAVALVLGIAYCVVAGGFGGDGLVYSAVIIIGTAATSLCGLVAMRKLTVIPAVVALTTAFVAAICLRMLMWALGAAEIDFFGIL